MYLLIKYHMVFNYPLVLIQIFNQVSQTLIFVGVVYLLVDFQCV